VKDRNITKLTLRDASGGLLNVIPVSPSDASVMQKQYGTGKRQLLYKQTLGSAPDSNEHTVAVMNGSGKAIDSVAVQFNCFANSSG